jgi:tetratricopeptide (TPR) repeat protein
MRYFLAAIILLGLAGTLWAWSSRLVLSTNSRAHAETLPQRMPYDPVALANNIAFYEKRAKADPQGAIERAMLAQFYLQRVRETGDIADALKAEQAARASLSIRTRNNLSAAYALTQSLVTQHRFAEALRLADRIALADPASPQARRLCAEIRVELGDYKGAEAVLARKPILAEDGSLKALRARLLDLRGQSAQALPLLRQAQAEADRNMDLPRENVAWFHLRVGDLCASTGKVEEAEKAYREAVDLFPNDYKAMYALARLAAGRKQWQEAVTWGSRAAEIVPAPETLALTGDAYVEQGRTADAERQYRLCEAIGRLAKAQGVVYDRQRALFCADHNRHLNEALRLARRELKARRDIYAWDTLAWVSYKAFLQSDKTDGTGQSPGLLAEAQASMKQALALGTQDARLYFHAACIARAAGKTTDAETLLTHSRALNAAFYPGPASLLTP